MGIPVLLDVAGWPALVIGGGRIGCRRAQRLVEAGAEVTILSSTPTRSLPDGVDHRAEDWSASWASAQQSATTPWRLVVAATDDGAINAEIVRWAESLRAITFRVDRDHTSDAERSWGVPNAAIGLAHCDGPMIASVFSSGAAPGLSRWLLDTLVAGWPDGIGVLATCAAEASAIAAATNAAARTHLSAADWQSLGVGGMLDAVRESDLDRVKERLAACLSS